MPLRSAHFHRKTPASVARWLARCKAQSLASDSAGKSECQYIHEAVVGLHDMAFTPEAKSGEDAGWWSMEGGASSRCLEIRMMYLVAVESSSSFADYIVNPSVTRPLRGGTVTQRIIF